MNAAKLSALLMKLDACFDARKWAEGKTLQEAWSECVRADWMCWLLVKMAGKFRWPNKRIVHHVLCDCAETALPIYAKFYPNDDRPRKAIETARRYADGKATAKELVAASAAAWDAVCAAAASAAASAADWDAARDAAWDAALKNMADIIRKRVPKLKA